MRGLHPAASELLDEWERLLQGSPDALADALVNPGLHYRDLRHVTPFAGVLNAHVLDLVHVGCEFSARADDASERAAVYREFRRDEMQG